MNARARLRGGAAAHGAVVDLHRSARVGVGVGVGVAGHQRQRQERLGVAQDALALGGRVERMERRRADGDARDLSAPLRSHG